MYLDVKGWVTTGVGNLIDPVGIALNLPFLHKKTRSKATQQETKQEWDKVKGMQNLKKGGGGNFGQYTTLVLDDDAITNLIAQRLANNERVLKSKNAFKNFDTWPADAQLALLSMSWAAGPNKFDNWKRFNAACINMDFDTAATESHMKEERQPKEFKNRNKLTNFLFKNAAAVIASESAGFTQYKRDVLRYLMLLSKPVTL